MNRKHDGSPFIWRCIICEKEMEILLEGKDDPASWPSIEGGMIEIRCAYGSDFDDARMDASSRCFQSCICDGCLRKKRDLIRRVEQRQSTTCNVLPHRDKKATGL